MKRIVLRQIKQKKMKDFCILDDYEQGCYDTDAAGEAD